MSRYADIYTPKFTFGCHFCLPYNDMVAVHKFVEVEHLIMLLLNAWKNMKRRNHKESKYFQIIYKFNNKAQKVILIINAQK